MLEYCESFRARQDNHHSPFRAKRKAAPPAAKKHSPKADEAVRQLKTRRTPQPHFAPKRQSRFPDLRSPPPYAFSDRSNGACMDAPSYSDGFAPESHRIPFPLSGLAALCTSLGLSMPRISPPVKGLFRPLHRPSPVISPLFRAGAPFSMPGSPSAAYGTGPPAPALWGGSRSAPGGCQAGTACL